jgi:hypothetical protein
MQVHGSLHFCCFYLSQDAEIIAKVDRIIAQHAIDTRRDFPELYALKVLKIFSI